MYEIGTVTAKEILVTGLDWTFAPTIAVVRDDRWGRTYESYSEDPAIVEKYAGALIEGIQGKVSDESFLDSNHLIATAKHFLGDGGTVDGRDQGNNISTEEELRDIQGAGYPVSVSSREFRWLWPLSTVGMGENCTHIRNYLMMCWLVKWDLMVSLLEIGMVMGKWKDAPIPPVHSHLTVVLICLWPLIAGKKLYKNTLRR